MTDASDPSSSVLQRARDAVSRRAWSEALELLLEADRAGGLALGDRPLLAEVAYAAGDLDLTIETWERAHAELARAGEDVGAAGAAVRVAMHLLFDTALMAPVRGWLLRAERLLGSSSAADTPVHAWFAVVRNYERMLSGDVEGARSWARRAIDIGARCEPAAAAIGRVAEARGLILGGGVKDGLALLEEAGVATVSGEIDPLSTGVVYCELVCALQGLAQFDLAEEWTSAMERWCAKNAIGSLHGRCRVHRAEILRLRGQLAAAEEQVRLACDELRPFVRRELGWPLYELGRIKLQQGDLDTAEDIFLEAHDIGWDAQPGLALVQLARGDVSLAAASIREAIEHPSSVPSKELPPDNDLRRAPLLRAQVEIGVAAGDLARARSASEELSRVATRFESKALVASAAAATGRVFLAEGRAPEAERSFEQASRLFHEIGAPYEAAVARTGLADACRASGHDATADLELRAARATFERLGVAGDADRRGLQKPLASERQVSARGASAPLAPNVLLLEGDTWSVTFEGHTVRVHDRKGMHYIARMLDEPQREIHVLDFVGGDPGGDAGPLLDAKAKEAYRRRLSEIEEDISPATGGRSAGTGGRSAGTGGSSGSGGSSGTGGSSGSGGSSGAAGTGGSAGSGGTDGGSDAGPACPTGTADCDQNQATVCETTLASDAKHCGSCARDCTSGGATCTNGLCDAVSLFVAGDMAFGSDNAGARTWAFDAASASAIWVGFNGYSVRRYPLAGPPVSVIWQPTSNQTAGTESAVVIGSDVYWSIGGSPPVVYKKAITAAATVVPTVVFNPTARASFLRVVGNAFYWMSGDYQDPTPAPPTHVGYVYTRATTAPVSDPGTAIVTVDQGNFGNIQAFQPTTDALYWVTNQAGSGVAYELRTAPIAGGTPTVVPKVTGAPNAAITGTYQSLVLTAVGPTLYFTYDIGGSTLNGIYKYETGDSAPTQVVPGDGVSSIVIDASSIYFTQRNSAGVFKAPIGGGGGVSISNVTGSRLLGGDAKYVYLLNSGCCSSTLAKILK